METEGALGYALLAGSALAAAAGILAQTVAVRRAERRDAADPGLLVRLASDRTYLFGFSAQVVAFGLAFLARATLPLFIVQAGSSSAVGLAALIGFVVLGWRVSGGELVALAVLAVGLLLLVGAAEPSAAAAMTVGVQLGMAGSLLLTALLAVPATRLHGARGAVVLGVLAGVAFAVVALCGRPLASGPLLEIPLRPMAWVMVAAAFLGQGLLAAALQRASTTSVMASMDATTVVIASVLGLAVLGDQVAAGRGSWVGAGLALVVAAVVGLALVGRAVPAAAQVRV